MLKLLGLVNRANKLLSGTDIVIEGLRNKKVFLVIVASDASSNTKKMMQDKTAFYNTPLIIKYKSEELSNAIGKKNRMVLGVTDLGFAKKLQEMGDNNG